MEKLFVNSQVQKILNAVSKLNINIDKVFKASADRAKPYSRFVLMTEKQFEARKAFYEAGSAKYLQIPPIMDAKPDAVETIEEDKFLHGAIRNRLMCVDISSGISGRDRLMTAREIDGKLRTLSWSERDRMNRTFFPRHGTKLITPKVFDENNLEIILSQKRYVEVLSRACAQFEPDDPEYIRVRNRTYNAVNEANEFAALESTRFFPGFIFHVCFFKTLDGLLIYTLRQEDRHMADLIAQLFYIMHPTPMGMAEERTDKVLETDPSNAYPFLHRFIFNSSGETRDKLMKLHENLTPPPLELKAKV